MPALPIRRLSDFMSIFDQDNNPLADREALRHHIRMALDAPEPRGLEMELVYQVIRRLFNPMVLGTDNIPRRPCLFVGNHSLFALDGWILGPIMMKELGRFPRALGDKFLFASESLGERLLKMGGVMGHPEVCSALMEDDRDIMVFPGGAREAVKPATERYELQWGERYGFVRLAAKHGYTIMPFGMVGPDEFYGHLMEGQDLPDSRLGQLLTRLGLLTDDTRPDLLPPVPLGALGTLIPKPQRCYIGFGEPIDLAAEKGKRLGKRRLQEIRDRVAEQIETQLAELLFAREQHKGQDSLLRRILTL
jgi:1-acyl-sn-glycerol-3-phosphate acyltransferase